MESSAGLTPEALLAEPPESSKWWLPALFGRLLAMRSGAVRAVESDPASPGGPEFGERIGLAMSGACGPMPDGSSIGSRSPRLIIVGERAPGPGGLSSLYSGAGVLLFRALRILGFDEFGVALLESSSATGVRRTREIERIASAVRAIEPTWISLGTQADRVLAVARIGHLSAIHPTAHLRHYYREGPEGFASRLEAACLPRVERRILGVPCGLDRPAVAAIHPALDPVNVPWVRSRARGGSVTVRGPGLDESGNRVGNLCRPASPESTGLAAGLDGSGVGTLDLVQSAREAARSAIVETARRARAGERVSVAEAERAVRLGRTLDGAAESSSPSPYRRRGGRG